jgi:uncharacterized protein (TIGR02996 family)
MATASEWRTRARRVIDRVLAGLPADADEKTKRAAVREAYPFGPREHHPYKCWLAEVKAALGVSPAVRTYRVRWLVLPAPTFYVRVDCGWCDTQVGPGCLACGERRRVLAGLEDNADLLALVHAARETPADPVPRLALADWLDEHDHGELADLFRGTTEG